MTREEAIEMLKALNMMLRNPDGEPISDVCEAIDMAIEALQDRPKGDWIPCSERLPEQSDDYICTIPLDEEETFVKVLTFHKGRFYEDDDEWGATFYDDVIAWMPLPTPYKGGDDE